MKIILPLLGFLFFVISTSFAQVLDRGDTLEIQSKARFCINQFESILNQVATPGEFFRNYNLDNFIRRFYEDGSPTQIFRDSVVIIEDDLNPKALPVTYEKEKTIQTYLNDFYQFYEKSVGISVTFSNLQVSEVKEGDYYYVTLTYESEFFNRHKRYPDEPYPIHKRIATIKAERQHDRWKALITHTQFFRTPTIEEDPIEPVAEEIPAPEEIEGSMRNVADAYKRGSTFDIAWKKDFENPVMLSLYQGATFQKELAGSVTNNEYAGIIPKKTKPGQAYRFQVYDPATKATLQSGNFIIKRKIPLGVQIPIYVGIAGGIYAIIKAIGGVDTPTTKPPSEDCTNCLPGPNDINPYQ